MTLSIDPFGRPTVMAVSDDYFHTCRPSVRPSVPTKQNIFLSENSDRYWRDLGLAEGIIDDTCLLYIYICNTKCVSTNFLSAHQECLTKFENTDSKGVRCEKVYSNAVVGGVL